MEQSFEKRILDREIRHLVYTAFAETSRPPVEMPAVSAIGLSEWFVSHPTPNAGPLYILLRYI